MYLITFIIYEGVINLTKDAQFTAFISDAKKQQQQQNDCQLRVSVDVNSATADPCLTTSLNRKLSVHYLQLVSPRQWAPNRFQVRGSFNHNHYDYTNNEMSDLHFLHTSERKLAICILFAAVVVFFKLQMWGQRRVLNWLVLHLSICYLNPVQAPALLSPLTLQPDNRHRTTPNDCRWLMNSIYYPVWNPGERCKKGSSNRDDVNPKDMPGNPKELNPIDPSGCACAVLSLLLPPDSAPLSRLLCTCRRLLQMPKYGNTSKQMCIYTFIQV